MALTYHEKGKGGRGSNSGQGGGGGGGRGSQSYSRVPPPRGSAQHQHQQYQRHQQARKTTQYGRQPSGVRNSVRSKSSSGASSGGKAKTFKDCCRRIVEFVFTQVGVGALVVLYTIMGASIFQHIETQKPDLSVAMVDDYRHRSVAHLWNLTNHFNVLNKIRWTSEINKALFTIEQDMVHFVQEEGYDQFTNEERWTFPAALMFALSVISMIGYGNVIPRTEEGKIATIVYACFGIPVYILYFMNMGKVFASILKWVYTKAYRWNVRRKWRRRAENFDSPNHHLNPDVDEAELDEAFLDELEQKVIVPSTTCLWVMTVYLLIGTIMFAEWEGWNYLDSIYFCVTSLLKIGFGDFVPGAKIVKEDVEITQVQKTTPQISSSSTPASTTVVTIEESAHLSEELEAINTQTKLVINFVYILVGMGIVAMCYYLLKEEVTVKVNRAKARAWDKWAKLKKKFGIKS